MTTANMRGLLLLFGFLAMIFLLTGFKPRADRAQPYGGETHRSEGVPRIAKVTMLYGDSNTLYERAVKSHLVHDERHNYGMHILRQEITGGYWNKPSYLLSLIVAELAKPKGERTEWLMWVDADLILINPSIPLEIFLPPFDFGHVHFLGNKDQNGLNTGTFFIHVHEWSVEMLAKAIAFPMFMPDVDLGVSEDQAAMQHVFNESSFQMGILFQPRVWYNTYEWHHAYEGKKGNLLVHFPGLEQDRWRHMSDWLEVTEQGGLAWDVPLERTHYANETVAYWQTVREARDVLVAAESYIRKQNGLIYVTFGNATDALRFSLLNEADVPARLAQKTRTMREELARTATG